MKIFKIIFILFFAVFYLSTPSFARDNVTVVLMYAGWHNNTHKVQLVMQEVIDSYEGKVDYILCNVEDSEKCKYVRKHRIRIPKQIPSVMVFVNNKLVLEKFYDNQSPEEFKNPIDSLILSYL